MSSNIVEFLRTRKFWQPIIAFVMTLLIWGLPQVLGIKITPELTSVMTVFLWSIASLVVHGDIRYDWINAEAAKSGQGG